MLKRLDDLLKSYRYFSHLYHLYAILFLTTPNLSCAGMTDPSQTNAQPHSITKLLEQ